MNEDFKKFIGTWKLVSIGQDGVPVPERGAHPTGLITYDASGWMQAQIQPDRPLVKVAGARWTPQEAYDSVWGYTAYFGTFTVDDVTKIVTHHRTGSVSPGWERQRDFLRRYTFSGNRVELRPVDKNHVLVWERLG